MLGFFNPFYEGDTVYFSIGIFKYYRKAEDRLPIFKQPVLENAVQEGLLSARFS
jgi:hypothetical protein